MKREAILDYFYYDGKLYSQSDITLFDGVKSQGIYEVVRLINGVPLFIEDHLKRMRASARLLGYAINKSDMDIIGEIKKLSKVNQCGDINVKILCCNLGENEKFFTYFIDSYYPQNEDYKKGVRSILYSSERKNPNVKTVNVSLRESINEVIKEENAFEALLVNKDGYITEGSRSNAFFVKDNTVYTAPSDMVLLGITRRRIIEVCKNQNILVKEEAIHEDRIDTMEGAFITGTSINVLPISMLDSNILNSVENKIIQGISKGNIELVNTYIKANTK